MIHFTLIYKLDIWILVQHILLELLCYYFASTSKPNES